MANAPPIKAAIAKNFTSFDMDEPPMPHAWKRQSRKLPARWLLPPALLLRNDYRPTNAVLLRQPGTAIAFGVGTGRDAARPDDDVRAAHGLRGEFIRFSTDSLAVRSLRERQRRNTGNKSGNQGRQGKNTAVFRHIHPIRNLTVAHSGCSVNTAAVS